MQPPEHDETAVCFASSSTCVFVNKSKLGQLTLSLTETRRWGEGEAAAPRTTRAPENSPSPNERANPVTPATCPAGLEQRRRDRAHLEEHRTL